jgi:hypothetical protein
LAEWFVLKMADPRTRRIQSIKHFFFLLRSIVGNNRGPILPRSLLSISLLLFENSQVLFLQNCHFFLLLYWYFGYWVKIDCKVVSSYSILIRAVKTLSIRLVTTSISLNFSQRRHHLITLISLIIQLCLLSNNVPNSSQPQRPHLPLHYIMHWPLIIHIHLIRRTNIHVRKS